MHASCNGLMLQAFTPRDVAWSGGACITDHLLVIAWDPAAHAICQQLHTPQLCLQACGRSAS